MVTKVLKKKKNKGKEEKQRYDDFFGGIQRFGRVIFELARAPLKTHAPLVHLQFMEITECETVRLGRRHYQKVKTHHELRVSQYMA